MIWFDFPIKSGILASQSWEIEPIPPPEYQRVKRQCGRAHHKLKLELQQPADRMPAHWLTIPMPIARRAFSLIPAFS